MTDRSASRHFETDYPKPDAIPFPKSRLAHLEQVAEAAGGAMHGMDEDYGAPELATMTPVASLPADGVTHEGNVVDLERRRAVG